MKQVQNNKIVIGILAHVDSGKTTLSESILYKTGIIRKQGRVDYGTSYLDTNHIERERGITIFSSQAVFSYRDIEFTLLDTPGHIDFSPEAERTLKVLDCAILVVSGSEGVQNHTETLWHLLESYNIPVFLFINKMDISPYSHVEIMTDLKKRLGDGCVNFNAVLTDEFAEELAVCDEALMESYVSGNNFEMSDIRAAVANRRLFPCYFGSALKSSGVSLLLDGLADYAPLPDYGSELGMRVYKISKDEQDERLTHVKVTGGSIRVRDNIIKKNPDGTETSVGKINSIRIYSGSKFTTINEATAGTICALTGLSGTYSGEGFGFEKDSRAAHLEPVLNYRVILNDNTDVFTALANFRRLEEEEPELRVSWNERLGEIYFSIMGEVQLEILKRLISERFGMDVDFDEGGIAYKETIEAPVIGIGHYEPLRHYAEVQLLLEPLPRGSGLRFLSDCPDNRFDRSMQRLVLAHLHEKTHTGVLTGSPITDIKITLIAGKASIKHTDGGDFREAAYRAVRQGLRSAKSLLLEPWYNFRLEVPAECIGRALNDLSQMGADFTPPESDKITALISGSAPVTTMRSYQRDLISYTKGKGKLTLTFKGYEKCHNQAEVIATFGYDPDRDIANTGDSIFCENGTGFIVKWDKVHEYKHIDAGIKLGISQSTEFAEAAERYMRAVASDAELMKIFESVYGPIKRRVVNEPKKIKAEKPAAVKANKTSQKTKSKEYLLIDGYNIIFAWNDLNKLAQKSLDLARNELIKRICNYQGFHNCETIIVFDAYKVKNNPGELEKINNINVVYTKEAETADTYIERVTHELAKTNRVRVATSDSQEQLIILGSGAIRISASAFLAEVEETEKSIREYLFEL
jgi:small GTP-binding protein